MSGSGGGAETIRSFLISIGYAETGRKQFSDNMVVVANQAVELGKTMARAAQEVVEAVAKIAESLEDLYFQSQRTRATVESINAIGFAASQTGSSVAAARGSLESFGRFLRTNPGGENFLSGLGVATRDANGNLRETGDLLRQTIKVLNTRQPGVAMAYANVLGIDEKTLLGLTAEADKFDATSRRMYRAAGVNQAQATKDSHELEVEYRTLGEALTVLQAKFMSLFAPRFAADIRRWRELIEHNFGPITKVMEWVVDKVMSVIDAFTDLLASADRVISGIVAAWNRLDPESERLIAIFAAIAVAWRLLEAAFALSPAGFIFALGAAILALVDDYNAWQRAGGSASLIDWGKWEGEIKAAKEGIASLEEPFHDLAVEVEKLSRSLAALWGRPAGPGMHSWLIDEVRRTFADLKNMIESFSEFVEFLDALASGDVPRMVASWRRSHAAPDPGVTPREGAIDSPLNSRGQMPGIYDLMDQRRREDGGDLWYRLFQAPAEGGNAVSRFANRAGRVVRGDRRGIGSASVNQQTAAEGAYNYWRGRGLDHNGALAMVAQEQQESGFNPANQSGDGSNAHGLYQWQAPRRAVLRDRAGIDVDTATADQQRDAAYAEMHGLDAGAVQAWAVLNNPNASLEDKVRAATLRFERPADRFGTEVPNRLAIAQSWGSRLGEGAAPQTAAPAPVVHPEGTVGSALGGLRQWLTAPTTPMPTPDVHITVPTRPAPAPPPTDDTTVKIDPEYLRNRNAPVIYPTPLLDVPPLGAPANNNVSNNSTVAPVINQTTNITLTGGAEQNRAVLEGQQSVNERLVRNTVSAVR